jgi:gliding motility associated protien GldN
MKAILLMLTTCLFLSSLSEAQQRRRRTPRVPNPAPAADTTNRAPAPVAAVAAPPSPMDSIRKSDSLISASGYDPLSVRKVHVSDVMYKMQVWRIMDLREKCNQPFLAKGNEITKAICEAVASGKLNAYATDSLNVILTPDKFNEKLTDPDSRQLDAEGNPVPNTGTLFLPDQLYILKFRENLLFDKQRSRFYYDIQTLTLIIPAVFNKISGTETEVASFRYADVAKVFRNMPNARWYNSQNRAEDKRISDAMDLRLFCSRILKISNPKNQLIEDMPEYRDSPRSVLVASQKYEYELVAKENEVWDY